MDRFRKNNEKNTPNHIELQFIHLKMLKKASIYQNFVFSGVLTFVD